MQLVLFKYQEDRDHLRNVRTAEINGEVWFLAKDVCQVLGYLKPENAVSQHCKQKGTLKQGILTKGGMQQATFINESNVYRLIVKSKLPTAEKFEEWLFETVIPSIRKTGGYGYHSSEMPNFYQRYVKNIHNVERGYFSVITELMVRLFSQLEHHGYIIPDMGVGGANMCPDISVGRAFATYLKERKSPYWDQSKDYLHEFTDGRKPVMAKQYPNAALPLFIDFVDQYWIPYCAEKYFRTKDPKALDYLPKLLPNKAS